ncbi:MAG: DUF1080 domain-containing protein [Verrucomicrobia bacterium]|nr:DUF1080 domain-containing protein [Verrucomicrobiota bacterium]
MKIITLCLLLLYPTLATFADDVKKPEPPKTFIDPAKVDDEDYAIQGEYVGEIDTGELKGKKFGVQIWAQGDGNFEAVSYEGGLPGAGWNGDRSTISRVKGQRAAGEKIARFEKEDVKATSDGKNIQVMNLQGERFMEMSRVSRQSPTLGAKPPAGAIVLFDGKDSNHFPGSKVTDDGLLEQGATSSDKLEDGTLHIEFMLAYKPAARGQQRGNSGVYLQSRYEVQVLDSFGLEAKNNDCGAIYSIRPPTVNMSFPPLTWQTYDIDFTAAKYDAAGNKTTNARMTVKHNGVLVHDNVEVPHITTSAPEKEQPTPGPLHLQNHGNPARYRNIWFLPK